MKAAITVQLTRPVTHEGRDYAVVNVDEPSVGGIEIFEAAKKEGRSEMTATLEMLAFETGWPFEVVKRIKLSDMVAITEAQQTFLPEDTTEDGGPTAATSAPTSPTS